VDAGIGREFRVEGGDQMATLLSEDGISVIGGEHLNGGAGGADDGSANEDRFEVPEGGREIDDAGIELAAVGVALDFDIHEPERLLFRGGDVRREEDGSGAGAEDGLGLAVSAERLKEIFAMEDFEHGGAFASRQDEAVGRVHFSGGADLDGLCARCFQRAHMPIVVPLQGEDSDDLTSHGFASARRRRFSKFRGQPWPSIRRSLRKLP